MKILDIPQSGKRGQVVAFQSRFGLCLRQWVIPRNTITPAREHMRSLFGICSRMWSGTLTEEQRNRWSYVGSQVMSHPRLAQKGPLSGQQFWQSVSSIRALVGLPLDLEPPAPVIFQSNPVGPLVIENTQAGVRLFLLISSEPDTDVMLFGQEPCPAGRRKRRNVAYLGLLPPPMDGRIEITQLYTARYGEPRPGRKIFVVTCQQKNGWKDFDLETSEIVPHLPQEHTAAPVPSSQSSPAPAQPPDSHFPYMHKGGTRDVARTAPPPASHSHASTEPTIGLTLANGPAPDPGGGNGDLPAIPD